MVDITAVKQTPTISSTKKGLAVLLIGQNCCDGRK